MDAKCQISTAGMFLLLTAPYGSVRGVHPQLEKKLSALLKSVYTIGIIQVTSRGDQCINMIICTI